ncbi:MAG: ribonuclease R [Lachnospiraceae bacterium]|nr:ribonuclease R [Lachnospiraceae bacterium]
MGKKDSKEKKNKKVNKEKEFICLTGTFMGTEGGFGFVSVEGFDTDFHISESRVNGAIHRDKVEIKYLHSKKGGRPEAEVIGIVERGIKQVVGTFERSKNYGFVTSDSKKVPFDVFIAKENIGGAVDGSKVVATITNYGDGRRTNPEGVITEVLGYVNEPGVDILAIAKGFDIPTEFPGKVLKQAERVATEVTEADRAGRSDLRKLTMVTIDGEDAKDLDDAVSLEKLRHGHVRLGVHIADVANYVQEKSALDKEAIKRGTSVYLVDRVIPMLPVALSNGMCSLNAGEDRLALTCFMEIDKEGNIVSHSIEESVINVDRRLSYTQVQKVFDKDKETLRDLRRLKKMLLLMKSTAELLRDKRQAEGSIDFDLPESKIKLDASGKPISIEPYIRNDATRLIEDFMLAANTTVAEHFYWQETPFLYRVHGAPDNEKMEKLATFIRNFGYFLKKSGRNSDTIGKSIHPKEIQKLLKKIEGTPEETLISRLTLRSMQRAKYSDDCTGHFGLAFKYYTHFTSPIRRYPDLQIHRIIKDSLRGRLDSEKMDHYRDILPNVAKVTSETERRADEAEREVEKLKKVQFMEGKEGKVFDGVISGITKWGIYVELANSVEGLIHISRLVDDYYDYKEDTYEMVGESTGKRYTLGEEIKVRLLSANVVQKTIDFVPVREDDEADWERYLDR